MSKKGERMKVGDQYTSKKGTVWTYWGEVEPGLFVWTTPDIRYWCVQYVPELGQGWYDFDSMAEKIKGPYPTATDAMDDNWV
jgi:hypothetical protein